VGISTNLPSDEHHFRNFWLKSPIGTTLEMEWARIGGVSPRIRKKGDWTMSGLKFERHLVAAFAALLMSSIAVGAAVAPAQVSATPVEVVTYA
jgi:hypothetical protein